MATYLDGNRRRATANTVTAMRRSAAMRQCPKCGRRGALVRDAEMQATYCRWSAERNKKGDALCSYYIEWA